MKAHLTFLPGFFVVVVFGFFKDALDVDFKSFLDLLGTGSILGVGLSGAPLFRPDLILKYKAIKLSNQLLLENTASGHLTDGHLADDTFFKIDRKNRK